MGNKTTIVECFDKLGVSKDKHTTFKQNVLDFAIQWLQSKGHSGDLTIVSKEKLSSLTQDYLASEDSQRFVYLSSRESASRRQSDTILKDTLLQLIDIWKTDLAIQQSQDDPPYTASGSAMLKKRKRMSDHPTNTATHTETPKKKLFQRPDISAPLTVKSYFRQLDKKSEDKANIAHSLTIDLEAEAETDADETQDIQYRQSPNNDAFEDCDSEGLPSLQDLLSIPGPRGSTSANSPEDPLTPAPAQKGKAPVRDPPMSRPAAVSSSSFPVRTAIQTTSERNYTFSAVKPAARLIHVAEESSPSSDLFEGEVATPQSSSNMRLGETGSSHSDDDELALRPAISQTMSPHLTHAMHAAVGPLTPPPTTRKRRAADIDVDAYIGPAERNTSLFGLQVNIAAAAPAINNINDLNYTDRLIDSIRSYIRTCERHSIQLANSPTSSERERQRHQIQAAIFSSLKADMQSRFELYRAESTGDKEQIAAATAGVTSCCLWL